LIFLILSGILGLGYFWAVISGGVQNSVDPCDCSEVGSNVQIVGYDNLSKEDKKLYDACERTYSTPAAAYEACVESQMPKK